MNQSFKEWHSRHGCSAETLYYIQNCLGSMYGFDDPNALQATIAWQDQRNKEKAPEKGPSPSPTSI